MNHTKLTFEDTGNSTTTSSLYNEISALEKESNRTIKGTSFLNTFWRNQLSGRNITLTRLVNFIYQYRVPLVVGMSLADGIAQYNHAAREVSYSFLMKTLAEKPELISFLDVLPRAFKFVLNGKVYHASRNYIEPVVLEKLVASGVRFRVAASESAFRLSSLLMWLLLLPALASLVRRQFQPKWKKLFDGGVDNDEVVAKSGEELRLGQLSFEDIAGQEIARTEVQEVCDMLRHADKYKALGAHLPSGVLLVGPPGSGKTLLARITAAEANVPFYACAASDFIEIYVGRGPQRVRKLFQKAAKTAPCIVFIDEIDTIGRSRMHNDANSELDATLNQILTCMDGLDTSNNGVIVMAATNRLDVLDEALLRAGRFDRIVNCPLPDKKGRVEILQLHARKVRLAYDVDFERLAVLTPGASGADLSTIVNEAAIRAARRGGANVTFDDFESALQAFYATRSMNISGWKDLVKSNFPLPTWLKSMLER